MVKGLYFEKTAQVEGLQKQLQDAGITQK